ncbi:restriction endonuclease [Ureaplasma canigenitalium]|uniref:restriction endonuclease n=1 Tax=Ureaplasma canigenitalium TaxID=42092 RepID=UPI000572033F|nr:restriction endonuclease [Ureaplasma canigenitalium]
MSTENLCWLIQKNTLDQYYTKNDVAKALYNKARSIINVYEDISEYTWIEPSVGEGCFFDLLPENKKIGIDIDPKRDGVLAINYLKYQLPSSKTIVIGNPPFGHRGVLALEFINHSRNADFVCFILPMFFESKGKGSIRYRVKGFNLIHNEVLPKNSFYLPNGKDVDVKCVFQICSKKYSNELQNNFNWYTNRKANPFQKYLDVFTVSTAKNRECGKKWIFEEKADFYLSSTFYDKNKVVYDFKDVKYGSGIAIKINTKDENEIKKIQELLINQDWVNYSSLATNSCRHIGKSHIYDLLFHNGFKG